MTDSKGGCEFVLPRQVSNVAVWPALTTDVSFLLFPGMRRLSWLRGSKIASVPFKKKNTLSRSSCSMHVQIKTPWTDLANKILQSDADAPPKRWRLETTSFLGEKKREYFF